MPSPATKPAADAQVRRRLLDSAGELFARCGYAATTVREIVAAAGVSKPALYYYFQNKEGIYLELMNEAFGRFGELLQLIRESRQGTSRERLNHLISSVMELIVKDIRVVRVMYAIYYGPPQGAPFFDFDHYHRLLHEAVEELVAQGQAAGEFRPGETRELAWAIMGALVLAVEQELSCPADETMGAAGLTRVLDLIMGGIASRGVSTSEGRES